MAVQYPDVKEPQRGQLLADTVGGELLSKQCRLIVANVFGPKAVGSAMEVQAELFDSADVATDGGLGEVTTLQLLEHDLA